MYQDTRKYQIQTVKGEVAASAATTNLVVYVDDVATSSAVLDRAEHLAKWLPARIVLLDATQKPRSTELVPPPQHIPRCDLQIQGLAAQTIISLVNRTLRRSLPTCLWYSTAQETKNDSLLLGLAELAKYLVIDTAAGQGALTIADLAHVYTRLPKLMLRDLSWKRTAPWRDAVARLFDDSGVMAELAHVIRIEIQGSSESEALYLLGWLSSRLGWAIAGEQRFVDRDGNLINFFFHRLKPNEPHLSSIRLRSSSAEFSAQLSQHSEAITCTYGMNGSIASTQILPYQELDDSQLIERSLLRAGNDELFEAALRIVRDLGRLAD